MMQGLKASRNSNAVLLLCALGCFLLLAACMGSTSQGATQTAELATSTSFLTATPSPSPTPQPALALLRAQPETLVEQSLRTWADQNGWLLTALPFDSREGWQAQVGLRAVVVDAGDGGGEILGEAPAGIEIVLLDALPATASPNVYSVGGEARHDEAGFLAGAMAGLASSSWVIGLVVDTGGEHQSVYEASFNHGLRYTCPYCYVVGLGMAELTPEALASTRVDVAFVIPGPREWQASQSLGQAGVWVVRVGRTPLADATESLAGGVEFCPQELLPGVLDAVLQGEEGRDWPYAAGNGGIQLGEFNAEAISPGRQRVLQEIKEALASGELEVGVDPLTGEEL
jgi:hypothetical protein